MITNQLINPNSIAIIGASNDVSKPGGKVLKNLINHNFEGSLYVVNLKEAEVQGIKSFASPELLPQVDLAILAIAARYCPDTVKVLAEQKNTKAFIILSAGFHEESHEGALLENQIVEILEKNNACLIGPNCIGMMNHHYAGVFTTPIPKLEPHGVDFISGSGATAVFIMEASIPRGLTFSSVWSVGNSAQIGVEDVLEYLDTTFDEQTSSKVKLLYIESVNKPEKLLKHASSLINKGCRIAAIKSGGSEAGSRAASSHTGALASSDAAVDALFRKAGIVRCNGREELATVASAFMHKPLTGKRIAIITHAGGPAVMLTDALSNGGLEAQLGHIIDYCDQHFDQVDAMAVIFGCPGLFEVYDVYKLLHEKMLSCKKPIYPVLPSIINVAKEIDYFIGLGRINFPDEVQLGQALAKIYNTPAPQKLDFELPTVNYKAIRQVIEESPDGYLQPEKILRLLDAAGIPRAKETVVADLAAAMMFAGEIGFPLVMKVVGPLHKSDKGGVILNIQDMEAVNLHFANLMAMPDVTAVLIQPMLSGTELFAGVNYEPKFGHMLLAGMGGIYIEILKDFGSALAPVNNDEALQMIRSLRSYKLFEGARGKEGISEACFADVLVRLSALLKAAPEIMELDLNPLLGRADKVTAVDARIRIQK